MFKRFAKPAPTPAQDAQATVHDRYTDRVIFAGSKADCLGFISAFGLCYLVEA